MKTTFKKTEIPNREDMSIEEYAAQLLQAYNTICLRTAASIQENLLLENYEQCAKAKEIQLQGKGLILEGAKIAEVNSLIENFDECLLMIENFANDYFEIPAAV